MIAIMSKHCIEDYYEELNVCLCTLIGYYDDIDKWKTTRISKMQMAFQHVETFLVTFPKSFLARRWEQNIIYYLTVDELAPALDQLLETQNTSFIIGRHHVLTATTSSSASAKSIASELSTLQAEQVSHRLGGAGGSHQTMIQWQCQPLANW